MTGTVHCLPDFKGKNVPFFSNIPVNGVTQLMGKAKTITYVRRSTLDSSVYTDCLFIIFYGKVQVKRVDTESSNEVTIQIEEPNTSFGEIALLTDELRAITVITLQRTLFAVIRKNDFNTWLVNYIGVKSAFLPVLAEKN
jgi:CRP/FNR family transcriptional regulator, cyclic AMP receptor protein